MRKLSDYDYHQGCIDLHVHSIYSDGTFSPNEILIQALQLGLKAISITDHDTLEGSIVALKSGIPHGLRFIPGVEISVSPLPNFNIKGSIHILGYGVKTDDSDLSSCLKLLRLSRWKRAQKLINRLKSLNISICEKDLINEANGKVIGRPHFANLMVKMGFARSFKDAFDRFLGKSGSAYIRKQKVNISDILSIIKNAGGVSVLAHPSLIGISNFNVFEQFIVELKSMGLLGIEVIYPEHSGAMSKFYFELAHKHNLLVTGGTDFHGKNSPDLELGFGRGNFFVPEIFYRYLLKAINNNLKYI